MRFEPTSKLTKAFLSIPLVYCRNVLTLSLRSSPRALSEHAEEEGVDTSAERSHARQRILERNAQLKMESRRKPLLWVKISPRLQKSKRNRCSA